MKIKVQLVKYDLKYSLGGRSFFTLWLTALHFTFVLELFWNIPCIVHKSRNIFLLNTSGNILVLCGPSEE